jgi:organic hydroperoxide reductase OsmC/OhrA
LHHIKSVERTHYFERYLRLNFSFYNIVKGATIDGVSEAQFKEIAEGAKANCIISKALSVPITLNVTYA